ncbi:MAG: alpha/beta fold hydrolase, partial [Chloroflexota bacterium]
VMEEASCEFPTPQGYSVDCGFLTVPEDWSEPDGETIRLHFGVFEGSDSDAAEAPLVYLTGGPGQSALQTVSRAFPTIYEPLLQGRDMVLLDQRGTAYAEPSLRCDEFNETVLQVVEEALEGPAAQDRVVEALTACHERLVSSGIDLSAYNSANNAADVDALREVLGYDEWDVYGVSYGSRLAQTIMRDFPEGVRSVVLDSAYPVEADLYEETPANVSRAFDVLFESCENDSACASSFPDLESTLFDLVDQLNEEPGPYSVTNPQTGEQLEARLTGDGLLSLLFSSLYSTGIIPHLPELIEAAEQDTFDTLGVLEGAFLDELQYTYIGMQLSVQCGEEIAFSSREELESALSEHPELQGMFEMAPTLGPEIADVCQTWDVEAADEEENEPVESDIPTLILAGEFDPITPPSWGEMVSENLSNSHFLEFPATGHGVAPSHECAEGITLAFLDDPSSAPSSECIDDIQPPEFTPGDVDPELRDFEHGAMGISTVVPEGWTEVGTGVFQKSLLVTMAVGAIPEASPDQLIQSLTMQLGLDEPPERTGTRETDAMGWSLYRVEAMGQVLDLALTESDGATYIVQLSTTPSRRSAHYEQVFLPVVDELRVLN